jgi:hypothetical protein
MARRALMIRSVRQEGVQRWKRQRLDSVALQWSGPDRQTSKQIDHRRPLLPLRRSRDACACSRLLSWGPIQSPRGDCTQRLRASLTAMYSVRHGPFIPRGAQQHFLSKVFPHGILARLYVYPVARWIPVRHAPCRVKATFLCAFSGFHL